MNHLNLRQPGAIPRIDEPGRFSGRYFLAGGGERSGRASKRLLKTSTRKRLAGFSGEDIDRMMQDPKVIRNRAKLEGVILNARRLLELDKEYRGFKNS